VKSRIPAASSTRPNDRHKAITTAGDFTDFAQSQKTSDSSVPMARPSRSLQQSPSGSVPGPAGVPTISPSCSAVLVMIQLNILSGRRRALQSAARRFPFRIGRASGNELQLDGDRHLGAFDIENLYRASKVHAERCQMPSSSSCSSFPDARPMR